jgi:hypothetical protein
MQQSLYGSSTVYGPLTEDQAVKTGVAEGMRNLDQTLRKDLDRRQRPTTVSIDPKTDDVSIGLLFFEDFSFEKR